MCHRHYSSYLNNLIRHAMFLVDARSQIQTPARVASIWLVSQLRTILQPDIVMQRDPHET